MSEHQSTRTESYTTTLTTNPKVDEDNVVTQNQKQGLSNSQLKTQFDSLVNQWREDTRVLSDAALIFEHPAYQSIISIGEPMLPFIHEDLLNGGGHWYYALRKITGYTPKNLKSRKSSELRRAWLQWLNQRVLL
ncbi:MAG: hypothetical protein F4039_04590 [Gammaproteobacteria bacterium]|nr:hypothetical protein [Gammaproteobacteria bacterium]MXX95766.1 hypothetical protein [Gammaproteobacteria bacterium]MYF52540.1 hypothetical protein [Gammaproteobacteria bacterium]MYK43349.1 hypothetical protein [Gammaproteobacteria bacterium]